MVTELFFLFSLLHLVITTSTAKSLELPVFNNYLLLFYPVAMGLWESSSEDASTYTDLLTFAFRGPVAYDDHRPLFLDAEDPARSLTASQFRSLVRTLIAGLQAHHVQRGDCVLLHLGNSVGVPPLPSTSANHGWEIINNS